MAIDIKQLIDEMEGIDFRSYLNTNFQNLKNAAENLQNSTENKIIYTDTEITNTENYSENFVQVVCNNEGVLVKQLVDGEWQELCKYDQSLSSYIEFQLPTAGMGYPIENTDDSLVGMPVGYNNGTKVLAGITVDGVEDPIHAVGWYIDGHLLKVGRLKLAESQVAGSPVYVCNETGGWTLETPIISGQLVQVIGFVSDDGLYIDFDIQPWCIVA